GYSSAAPCFPLSCHEKVKFSRRLGVELLPLPSPRLIFPLSSRMSPKATPTPSHSSNQRREQFLPPFDTERRGEAAGKVKAATVRMLSDLNFV
ncbi:hypothetical protein AVEN_62881-2-1, partial [Araneus ventricosus]